MTINQFPIKTRTVDFQQIIDAAANAVNFDFINRSNAAAAAIPLSVGTITVLHDGVSCTYTRNADSTALTTSGGETWGPAKGSTAYFQHWGINTYATTAEAEAALDGMTASERTAHQAALEEAMLDTEGPLVLNGYVEAIDALVVGNRCEPDVIGKISGENLDGGFHVGARFNMSADAVLIGGKEGSGSYAPYIKSAHVIYDQSAAEASGDVADLVQYPLAFDGREGFGEIETLRVTRGYDGFELVAPPRSDGTADNIGGWTIGRLQLACLGTDADIANGFHHVKIDQIDSWVWGLGATKTDTAGSFVIGVQYTITTTGTTDFTAIGAANNNPGTRFTATGAGTGTGTATYAPLVHLRNRIISGRERRDAIKLGRADSFQANSIATFQGGNIVYDRARELADGNENTVAQSITDQFANIVLDGDFAQLKLVTGRTQIGRLYGTEDTTNPPANKPANKVYITGGTHQISNGTLVGNTDCQLRVEGEAGVVTHVKYSGIIRNTNINGRGAYVTSGTLILEGCHFILTDAAPNVPFIEQGGDGELVIKDCTAEVWAANGTRTPIQIWKLVYWGSKKTQNFIDTVPRTRAEMVEALQDRADPEDYNPPFSFNNGLKGAQVYFLDGVSYMYSSVFAPPNTPPIADLPGLNVVGDTVRETVAEVVAAYETRSELVADEAAGKLADFGNGAVIYADGLPYKRQAGASSLTDLPNWVEASVHGGDVDYLNEYETARDA